MGTTVRRINPLFSSPGREISTFPEKDLRKDLMDRHMCSALFGIILISAADFRYRPITFSLIPIPSRAPARKEGLVYNIRILGCAESACV